MPKFEIQHFTLCDGWINTWSITDESGNETLEYFDSLEDAKHELDTFLADEEEAYFNGWIEDKYQRSEFRIREVQNA